MELNLLPILNCDGKHLPVSASISLSGYANDDFNFLEPVKVSGEIVNISGRLELTAECTTKLERVCDRCAESYVFDFSFPLNEQMKKSDAIEQENDNPDVTIIDGNVINLDELVYSGLFMNLPSKSLCSDDCRGICPVCGKNKNQHDCSCESDDTDPRFDLLNQLL